MSERLGSIRTPWTDIVLAQQGDPATRSRCLEMLAEKYHNPIRSFIQTAMNITQPHRLDEVAQGYFHKFLEKNFLKRLDRERGTLRGFFMQSVKSYVLDEIARGKSDTSYGPFSKHHGLPPGDNIRAESTLTPEEVFMTVWAREFMNDVVEAFRLECLDHGKPHYFEVFDRRHLRPEHYGNPTNAEIAEALGINEKRVANCLHNAKRNFNTMLRAMVRASVAEESMVEQEMLDLKKYLWLAVKH